MNRLSEPHKRILSSLSNIYSSKENSKIYFSKRRLREILIHFKWNKDEAINAIESGQCDYWWSND